MRCPSWQRSLWPALVIVVGVLALHVFARVVNELAAFLRQFSLIWRFLSGHTLDGVHRTNATWTRRGDKVLHPTGRAHPWHHLTRWERLGIRSGSVLLVLLIGAGLIFDTLATVVALLAAAAGALALRGMVGIPRRPQVEASPARGCARSNRALTPVLGAPPHPAGHRARPHRP